jgi:hypothetical protein
MTLSAAIHAQRAQPLDTQHTLVRAAAGDVKVFYMDRAICHFQYVFVPRSPSVGRERPMSEMGHSRHPCHSGVSGSRQERTFANAPL